MERKRKRQQERRRERDRGEVQRGRDRGKEKEKRKIPRYCGDKRRREKRGYIEYREETMESNRAEK